MADLFADGFESGDLTAWSSNENDGGDLSAAEAAALHGTYGLSALIDDTTVIYVEDATPDSPTRYRCRFYFDPNTVDLNDWHSVTILRIGWTATVDLIHGEGTDFLIKAGLENDAAEFSYTSEYAITDEPHCIEVDWKQSSGADDGYISLWIDGVLKETKGSIDNDTKSLTFARLGVPGGLEAGDNGTMYFDDFASNNDGGEIGLIGGTEDFVYFGQTGIWSGLGMNLQPGHTAYIDTILANGITEVRHGVPYELPNDLTYSKAQVISWVSKGAKVIWGVTTNLTITSSNWAAYVTAVESAAAWAEANGVFEFQIGNELELAIDEDTITQADLIVALKSLATSVQSIYTIGNVSYSLCDFLTVENAWIAAGKGDLDILAANIYKGGAEEAYDYAYQTRITALHNEFGTDGFYLSEWAPSYTSLLHYSEDEEVQAAAVTEMLDFIQGLGMTRAHFYMWKDDGTAYFGVMKVDESYRELWQSLLNSGGSSLRFSGSAVCSYALSSWEYIASGSYVFSGAGSCVFSCAYIYTGNGTVIYSGIATQIYITNFLYAASGTLVFSGAGACFLRRKRTSITVLD